MELKIYQVDAFASDIFTGNPAAVVPLESWLPDALMQSIAMENNLSETAFFVRTQDGYDIRWFTPVDEVDLCGHATLGSAFVIFNRLGNESDQITFNSRSGDLIVRKNDDKIIMDFPSQPPEEVPMPQQIKDAFHIRPIECAESEDYIVLFESASDIKSLDPDLEPLKDIGLRGVIATARGDAPYDFVVRCFFPKYGVPEDPVTGSAFTQAIPFWAKKLGKTQMKARQMSQRGGDVDCLLIDDRVEISGSAVPFMEGVIHI